MKAICKYDPCSLVAMQPKHTKTSLSGSLHGWHGLDDEIKEIQEAMR